MMGREATPVPLSYRGEFLVRLHERCAGTVPARTGQIAAISGCRYSTISTYDGGMFCKKGARDFPHIDFAARSGLPWYKADPGC